MLDTRFTLALEQLMLRPQYRELAEAICASVPTGIADQHDAANRDTAAVYAAIAEHLGGTSATCIHAPTVERPTPVFTAAWKPGLVVCGHCIHLMTPRPGSLADRTCDGCGHECLGVNAGDPIYPSGAQMGSLIFQFGVCTSCRDDAESPTSRKATR